MRAHLLLGAAVLSLGACKLDRTSAADDAAQLTAGAPFELGLAPSFSALPYAEPAPVLYAPQPVAYDYWNDAYDMNQAYYNQPPAYYNYAGATPLVWTQPQPQSQSLTDTLTNVVVTRIVEALVGGGQREYFYQPGNDAPFFVRDPQYAYAIDDGRLVSVYDPYGRVLGEPLLMQQAPVVGRYLLRADSLRDAALIAALQPLAPDVWRTQRVAFIDDLDNHDGWRSTWIPGANRSPVAIQRLAEVRARKAARDEAHAAWKAQLAASRPVAKGLKAAKHDDDHPAAQAASRPAQKIKADETKPVKKADAAKAKGDKAKGKADEDEKGKKG
jgi:hypothetical protein